MFTLADKLLSDELNLTCSRFKIRKILYVKIVVLMRHFEKDTTRNKDGPSTLWFLLIYIPGLLVYCNIRDLTKYFLTYSTSLPTIV